MKKRTAILRGLAAVMAFLLFITVSGSNLMFTYAGIINNVLGISTSKVVVNEDSAEDLFYYDQRFGTDITNKQAALNVEMAVAAENISQAEEGTVLLKNENGALPLTSGSRVTVFGNGSYNTLGTASSTAFDSIPAVSFASALQEGLEAENVNLTLAEKVYSGMKATSATAVNEAAIADVAAHSGTWQNDYNDAAIVMFSRNGSEGNDSAMYTAEGNRYLSLSNNEKALMEYLQQQKQAGVFKKIIALVNSDQVMELGWVDQYDVDACVLSGRTGAVGFTGTVNVLTGTVNPSGHTVDTYAANSLSAPANTYAADNTQTWANLDYLAENCADHNGVGTNTNYYTVYAEGIYVGYKYYETRYEDTVMGAGNADSTMGSSFDGSWNYSSEVVYPFGHGLSYTTFDQELLSVNYDGVDDSYHAEVKVTNIGSIPGKSVVQVYGQTPYGDYEKENLVEKASVNLMGFAKTKELAAGESETVTVSVPRYFLASYDSNAAKGYILSAGDYYLSVGDNAHDALNNILAAKGYTSADGMDYDGTAAKTYSWNQENLDSQSYKKARFTDVEVTNQFDHADLNNHGIELTYLSRSDWEGTYPATAQQFDINDSLLKDMRLNWYEKSGSSPSVSDFTQGADNGLTFADMRTVDWEDEKTWNQFLDQMTVEEMAGMLMDSRGTAAIDSIGMPASKRADDNGGLGTPLVAVGSNPMKWTTEAMTARTWNQELYTSRGEIMGIEATFCNVNEIWYGGGNIHRTPVAGRNWQYYSEDGNLGYIVGKYEAQGMQSVGVNYCIKHFVLNDQETNREGISTFANEQSIREIYMRAFEGALCEGGALGVMTSFNRLGTVFSSADYNLVHNVLKGEWGFKGHVTTDGYTTDPFKQHFKEELTAGIDYTCASNMDYANAIMAEVSAGDGQLMESLRLSAKHNIYAMSRTVSQNGLSNDSTIVTIVPAWETGLLVATAIFAAGFVGFTIAFMVTTGKKREEEKKG